MASIRQYEDIEAWKLARKLTSDIYAVARTGAFARDFGLKDQIQRAAVSIGSNIAEGFERAGNKEFGHFLWIAKGSAAEVGSQLYTAYDVGYLSEEQFKDFHSRSKTICARIYKLIMSMNSSSLTGIRYRKSPPASPEPSS